MRLNLRLSLRCRLNSQCFSHRFGSSQKPYRGAIENCIFGTARPVLPPHLRHQGLGLASFGDAADTNTVADTRYLRCFHAG